MSRRRWRFRPFDEAVVARLETLCQVTPVVAHLLACRGLHQPEAARAYLENKLAGLLDPALLPGCEQAADVLLEGISRGERLAVYGDYDADGMCASAILVACLKRLGADVIYHVPNRLDDGYGLNHEALHELAGRGVKRIVTVDCGIASIDHAQTAKKLGLSLVITDHHEPGLELPEAAAIVHPRLPGHDYPCGDLCGAGVAFKLAWRLIQKAGGSAAGEKVDERYRPLLFRALGLAAMGTVADVVPLTGENRVLVAHGLIALKAYAPLGLQQLMEIKGLDTQPKLTSEDIAFTLAPRLNAAGRLGQAPLGVELLLTESEERAGQLARYIDELNANRDTLERSILRAASDQIQERFDAEVDPAFVLAERGWHAGVIGIVAGRLAEKHHRPVVMISLDPAGAKPGMGSARAGGPIDLHAALHACGEHLESYGGHHAAAGLKIVESNVDLFRAAFCEFVAERSREIDTSPDLDIDAETSLIHLTVSSIDQIERMAPFGQGNPRPLLCTRGVTLAEPPKRMGGGDRHLSLRLRHRETSMRAVAFGKGEWADEIEAAGGLLDVAYRPVINEFRGQRKVELHLVDWRVAES